MVKKHDVPAFRDPFLMGEDNALFPLDSEVMQRSDDDRADAFMTRFQRSVRPISRFPEYFRRTAKTEGHIFKDVKNLYRQCVINKGWSEKFFVKVCVHIFSHNMPLNIVSVDRVSLMIGGR